MTIIENNSNNLNRKAENKTKQKSSNTNRKSISPRRGINFWPANQKFQRPMKLKFRYGNRFLGIGESISDGIFLPNTKNSNYGTRNLTKVNTYKDT